MRLQGLIGGVVLVVLMLLLVCGGCSNEECKLCAPCDTCAMCDTRAPASIADLVAGNPTVRSVTLEWTSPGDDGNLGRASRYDIRYSTSAITDTSWCSAQQVVSEPAPKTSGQPETLVVEGLADDTSYYFALRTADERLNWSGLSNVVSARTLSRKNLEISAQDCLVFEYFVWVDGGYYGSFTTEAPVLLESQPGLHSLYARANIIVDDHTFCWTRDFVIVEGERTTVVLDCDDGICPLGARDPMEDALIRLRPLDTQIGW